MNNNPQSKLLRLGIRLEYLTLIWNVVGVAVIVMAAIGSRSVALAGFGLDSLIEIGASIVVIWELNGAGKGRQKKALRMIGCAFFALSGYILLQSAAALFLNIIPSASPLGMAWLMLTLVAMLLLAFGKGRTGAALGNVVLQTEARVTLVDAYLAGSTLVGVSLNAVFGWWWADSLAALVIVYYGIQEGRHAWSESAEE